MSRSFDSGYKCGKCGATIPVTNIATGKPTFWKKYPITHFWCDECHAITIIKPVVLEKDYLEFLLSSINYEMEQQEEIKQIQKEWDNYLKKSEGT